MHRHQVTICFTTIALLLGFCAPAHSQNTSAQIDIVGLRLGMSVEEARAQLLKYKPGIWNVTTYLTENPSWDSGGVVPQMGHPFHDAKLKVPVQVGAGYFEKIYVGFKAVDNQDTPIQQYSGEFFRLSFTPSDDGGKLYSIVRQRTYFSDPNAGLSVYAAAEIPLPRLSDLENGLSEKYGNPAKTENGANYVSLGWIYDRTGTKLANTHPEFAQCESRFDGEDGAIANSYAYARYMPRQAKNSPLWAIRKNGSGGYLTLREFAGAFSDVEFYKLNWGDSKTWLEDTATRFARQLVPSMVTDEGLAPSDAQGNPKFHGCGTQLHVVVSLISGQDRGTTLASAITLSLSDQNAEFFDNGVREYMHTRREKLNKLPPPPSKKENF